MVMSLRTLDEMRDSALARLEDEAEAVRRKLVTAAPGQAMAYEAKHQEATRFPGKGPFPFLEKEAESLGVSVEEVAESVRAARLRWEEAGSDIEARRMKAKKAIRSAATAPEMHLIVKEAFRGLVI